MSGAAALDERSEGVWKSAGRRLSNDRVGVGALAIVVMYLALIAAAALGVVARDWQREVGVPNAPPHAIGPRPSTAPALVPHATGPRVDLSDVDPLASRYAEWHDRAARLEGVEPHRRETLLLGGDRLGRDVLKKALKGAQISVFVGVAAAALATLVGTLLGSISGYFGGRIGDFIEWIYNVFTSIPTILLVFAFAAVAGRGITSVVLILGLAGWTGMYRLVRAEFMKHRSREYVRAAQAIGVSHTKRIFVHILPNVSHVILVQLSILVVAFIKSEVILSYLGLGVDVDQVSWGTMLSEAQAELVLGHFWQLATATVFMATFITAFSLLTDALRDALDPRLR